MKVGRADQAGFAQQQITRASRHRGQGADTGPGGDTAGATRSHESGAAHRRSGCRQRCSPGRTRSGRCERSDDPTSRTGVRRPRRTSGNGFRCARLPEPRTARCLCCHAACRVCARSVMAVQALLTPAWRAGPYRPGPPMPGRRDHRRRAGATSWPGPAPASPPARPPAHADGTAVRPALPGSTPRRSCGPCRKDQRDPCSSCPL